MAREGPTLSGPNTAGPTTAGEWDPLSSARVGLTKWVYLTSRKTEQWLLGAPTSRPRHAFVSRWNFAYNIRLESPRGVDEFRVIKRIYWTSKSFDIWAQSWEKIPGFYRFFKLGFDISHSFEIIRPWNFKGSLLWYIRTDPYQKIEKIWEFLRRPTTRFVFNNNGLKTEKISWWI